jgi:tRNA(fMet)-specific endonuclease VapC
MSFLLDTNIVSAHLRRPRGLIHRFVQHSGRLYVSTLSLAELFVWAQQSSDPTARVGAIDHMLHYEVAPLPYDDASARVFGQLRAALLNQGDVVNIVDVFLASAALAHDLTFVTHNTKDFARIPDLRWVDWLQS